MIRFIQFSLRTYIITGRNCETLRCCCDESNKLMLKKTIVQLIYLAEKIFIILRPHLNME